MRLIKISLEFHWPVPYNRVVQTFISMALVPFFAAVMGFGLFLMLPDLAD
jgi:hypothetical protein